MNLNLGEHWEAYVRQHVETGRYNSASEIIRESLRLHEEAQSLLENRRQALAHDINKAIASFENGETVDGPAFMKGLRQINADRQQKNDV
jgi:antitoxin ParD1/3/4